jgi:hypothetical protein
MDLGWVRLLAAPASPAVVAAVCWCRCQPHGPCKIRDKVAAGSLKPYSESRIWNQCETSLHTHIYDGVEPWVSSYCSAGGGEQRIHRLGLWLVSCIGSGRAHQAAGWRCCGHSNGYLLSADRPSETNWFTGIQYGVA